MASYSSFQRFQHEQTVLNHRAECEYLAKAPFLSIQRGLSTKTRSVCLGRLDKSMTFRVRPYSIASVVDHLHPHLRRVRGYDYSIDTTKEKLYIVLRNEVFAVFSSATELFGYRIMDENRDFIPIPTPVVRKVHSALRGLGGGEWGVHPEALAVILRSEFAEYKAQQMLKEAKQAVADGRRAVDYHSTFNVYFCSHRYSFIIPCSSFHRLSTRSSIFCTPRRCSWSFQRMEARST